MKNILIKNVVFFSRVLLLSVIMLVVISCARDVEMRRGLYYNTCSNTLYSGLLVNTYFAGQKKEEITIKEGKRNGPCTMWYSNGQKKAFYNYTNCMLNGVCTTWSEDGKKTSEITYKLNMRDGKSIWWYPNGQKELEENYKDGKYEGVHCSWYENGIKCSERIIVNGKRYMYGWYENGQKNYEIIRNIENRSTEKEKRWDEEGNEIPILY